MIPRRLYEHVKTHNWFAVAVDFVIVVAGVFVGIQVSNWNSDRLERRAARIYIERIREDIAVSELTLREYIAFYRWTEGHALAALDRFDMPKDELGESFLIDAIQASRYINRTVDRSTYDEMLSTGVMNSIPNTEIRRRLLNYYRYVTVTEDALREIPPYRDIVRRLVPWAAQDAIDNRCPITFSTDLQGRPLASWPKHCELELPEAVTKSAVAEIQNPEFKRDLVRHLADIKNRQRVYQRQIDRGRILDQFLAESKF